MGILKIFKGKDIPQELPDLATEKLKTVDKELKKDKEIISSYLKEEEKKEQKIVKPEIEKEAGFFIDLNNDINKELGDLNKIESWYNNKFLQKDTVSSMKSYWEKQKNISAIGILGKNYKNKITEKTSHLQNLEKEWQAKYFEMIEKEEEIRKEERELKNILAEFVEICKSRKKENHEKNKK